MFTGNVGAVGDYLGELRARIAEHPAREDCTDPECDVCGMRDCPWEEPLHNHLDGCPACDMGDE